jgi:hypothetical protein
MKSIRMLLLISGVYVIYTPFFIFQLIPYMEFSWLAPSAEFTFFYLGMAGSTGPPFDILCGILFYVSSILFVGLAVVDFLCAYYIYKGSKLFKRIASYRSLITCIFGICLIVIDKFVYVPLYITSWSLTTEGLIYFFFYGTIFSLLMMNEKKERQ